MRRETIRFVLLALLAALGYAAGPAWARDRAAEDQRFIQGLLQRGFFDLADEFAERLKGSAATPEEKVAAVFAQAEILFSRAVREQDGDKAQKLMAGAINLLRDAINANPKHPSAAQARVNLSWLQSRQVLILIHHMKQEQDAEKAIKLRAEAVRMYGEIESGHRMIVKPLREANRQLSDDEERTLMESMTQLINTLLDHAKMPGLASDERRPLLNEAIQVCVDFQYDFGNRPIAHDIMRLEGLCWIELGDYKKAEIRIKAALSLRDRLRDSKMDPNEYHLSILRDSNLALAKLYNRSGKPMSAVEAVDKALNADPAMKGTEIGHILTLEKANGYAKAGDLPRANAVAEQIVRANPPPRVVQAVRDMQNSWRPSEGAVLTPENLMASGDSRADREQWHDALADYRRVVEISTSATDRHKYAPAAHHKMGKVLFEMRRYGEAAYAFETVVNDFRQNELAPSACFEAMRCAQKIANVTDDPKDEAWKDQYLNLLIKNWPNHPVAKNMKYFVAEKLETAKKFLEAAEMFRQVPPEADLYESALVRAGVCYYMHANAAWEKGGKSDKVKPGVAKHLQSAEECFRKFLGRLGKPELEPKVPELIKQRTGFATVANQYLAYVYMHDAIGRNADALAILDQCAKTIPPDDERLAKIWETKIRVHLNLKQYDKAIHVLEMMFENQHTKYGLPIARASKSVAIHLDELTIEMEKEVKGKPTDAQIQKRIRENLKNVSRYYTTWLNEGPPNGLRVTMADVVSVSEALYVIARRLNGLTDKQASFLDLGGQRLPDLQAWKDAAFVHTLLIDERIGKLPDEIRVKVLQRLARCSTFVANTQAEWLKAKSVYDDIIKDFQLVDGNNRLQVPVLNKHPILLGLYIESGYVYLELARFKQKFQYDSALTVFNNVTSAAQAGSEPWWLCKFGAISALYERGSSGDIQMARIAMENLERTYADYDGGKYNMKARFVELKQKLPK